MTEDADTYGEGGFCFSRKLGSAVRPNAYSWRKMYDSLAWTASVTWCNRNTPYDMSGNIRKRKENTHLFPTLNLCFGVDAWDGVISSCTMGYDRGLCDQQGPWCRTALRIVGDLPGPGGMRGTCSKLGQRGKNNAVLKYYPANSDGFEERGCLPSRRHGWQWSGRAISEEALWDSSINCRDCMLTRFIGTQ